MCKRHYLLLSATAFAVFAGGLALLDYTGYAVISAAVTLVMLLAFLAASFFFRAGGELHQVFDVISHGNCGKLEELMKESRGLVVAVRDSNGATPLHRAALEARVEMVRVVLTHARNPNVRESMFGFTPLHLLACRGYAPLVTAMHPQMNVGKLCSGDRCEQEVEIARLLIENGAEVNSKAGFNRTPLHLAALGQKPLLTELLIAQGALTGVSDDLGFRPLHYAAFGDSTECIRILSETADINIKANLGYTPLHIASERGNGHVVEFLIAYGADLMLRTEHKMTAAALARQRGHRHISEMIEARG